VRLNDGYYFGDWYRSHKTPLYFDLDPRRHGGSRCPRDHALYESVNLKGAIIHGNGDA
jgi:hypothetical protein